MTSLQLPSGTYCFVTVPKDKGRFLISYLQEDNDLIYFRDGNTYFIKSLPAPLKGWEIIGKGDELHWKICKMFLDNIVGKDNWSGEATTEFKKHLLQSYKLNPNQSLILKQIV